MQQIDISKIIEVEYPAIETKPNWVKLIVKKTLSRMLKIQPINSFLKKNYDIKGVDLIDEIFETLFFTFRVSDKDYTRIPSEGRIICVSNHPIGSLDALSLLKTIYKVRKDVKIVANRVLSNIKNFSDLMLTVDIFNDKNDKREVIKKIGTSLENEEAVIIFPAGEVSRLKGFKVTDRKWKNGAIYFSKKYDTPILPMFVEGRNSYFFYLISAINKKLATLFLASELFNKRNKTINIKIGNPIPAKVFAQSYIEAKTGSKLLKKHVYRIGKNKPEIFVTEKNVIHPVDKKLLYKEINRAQLLGNTSDDKKIILVESRKDSPNILKEIARLRELTFRYVGEGTGKKEDIDRFDDYYKHIIVWDERELEIAGAYRIGIGEEIMRKYGDKGFYSSTLFRFEKKFVSEFLPQSLELGRSFVQRKYWNSNALHYLWLGLGAYFAYNPDVKYLFGPVSLSNSYQKSAKELIILYFKKWFLSNSLLAKANHKFVISNNANEEFNKQFNFDDRKKELRLLKNLLKPLGYTIPVLYKHYSELCYDNGVQFLDFSIDPNFENCIDGLILVDKTKLTEEKYKRYIEPFVQKKSA